MKTLTKRDTRQVTNALGRQVNCTYQDFEVTLEDVGGTRLHYRGFNHSEHKFTASDVGKKVQVMTDGTNWTCWCWA